MYQASEAFHKAAQGGAPQKALLIFPDRVFTNDDVDVESGIELGEYFSTERDLSIGQAISSELSFSLFNPEGYLDEFGFGEFTATLGAMIHDEPTNDRVVCMVMVGNTKWVGARVSPYLTIGGQAAGTQPGHPVTAMLVHDGKVYCFGSGNVTVYSTGGAVVNETVCDFMKRKAQLHWEGKGYAWHPDERILEEWVNMRYRRYEFVPLGVFNAERPDVPTVTRINFTCNDRMMRFEVDMPSASTLGMSYPTTIGTLLTKLCQYYGVPKKASGFINEDGDISAEPEAFQNATARTVIGWIAEAAATNARIDRDGYLVLDWFRTADVEMDENNYMEFSPCWYTTEQIGKVYNRSTQTSEESTYGNGSVGYLIQDNPLLAGAE